MSVVGQLISRDPQGRTKSWDITDTDLLWCGRMLRAEDGRYDSDPERGYRVGRVMVSMIARRLGVNFFGGPYTSITHLLIGDPSGEQPYGWSQPLRFHNPVHPEAKRWTWEEIPEYYRRAVVDTLTGRVPMVAPNVVDAAAPEFTARRLADPNVGGRYGWRREQHGTRSWLISTSKSRGWGDVHVRGGASDAASLVKVLAAGAVGAVLLMLAKGAAL